MLLLCPLAQSKGSPGLTVVRPMNYLNFVVLWWSPLAVNFVPILSQVLIGIP